MIVGIGVDSIEINRVKAALNRSSRLQTRLFTEGELAQLPPNGKAWPRMAALFAAKEAVFKALGTGLAGHSWLEVEVQHDHLGAPHISLNGKAARTATDQGITRFHLSLTHDRCRALAFCVAEGD